MEQKLFEGVYFTDYRTNASATTQPKCAPHVTPQGTVSTTEPGETQFITFDQLKQVKDTAKLAYLFAAILKRQAWLVDSTRLMLEDQDLWSDPDVAEAVEENMPLVARYTEMLQWILDHNLHAVEKGDQDKCGLAKDNAESLRKLYCDFKAERGMEL